MNLGQAKEFMNLSYTGKINFVMRHVSNGINRNKAEKLVQSYSDKARSLLNGNIRYRNRTAFNHSAGHRQ